MYPYVAFLALLQDSSQTPRVALTEDCSDSPTVLATLAGNASVEVRSAIAGGANTCYAVTAVVDGKSIRGYVQSKDLVAIAEFERQRAAVAASMVEPLPTPVGTDTAVAAAAPPVAVEKPHYPPFGNFAALDMKGRSASVHGMKGKVNLVCFWSPRNKSSFTEILALVRLYGQFHNQGVDALSVSLAGDSPALRDTVDDLRLPFRNVPNGFDVAARYNIDSGDLPRTYVLNENFEIIASGLHSKAIEDLVKKLIAEK